MELIKQKIKNSGWSYEVSVNVNASNFLKKNKQRPKVPKWIYNPVQNGDAKNLVTELLDDVKTRSSNEVSFLCASHYRY